MQQNLQRFVEAKQREVVDYDNLYKTLNQYEQEFIKQYADSNDKFIIDAYRNLINYKNAIGQNLLNAQQELLIA
jgi:intein-encoded DNA endonuclease-like protein